MQKRYASVIVHTQPNLAREAGQVDRSPKLKRFECFASAFVLLLFCSGMDDVD